VRRLPLPTWLALGTLASLLTLGATFRGGGSVGVVVLFQLGITVFMGCGGWSVAQGVKWARARHPRFSALIPVGLLLAGFLVAAPFASAVLRMPAEGGPFAPSWSYWGFNLASLVAVVGAFFMAADGVAWLTRRARSLHSRVVVLALLGACVAALLVPLVQEFLPEQATERIAQSGLKGRLLLSLGVILGMGPLLFGLASVVSERLTERLREVIRRAGAGRPLRLSGWAALA
jgi:hypothetical protein